MALPRRAWSLAFTAWLVAPASLLHAQPAGNGLQPRMGDPLPGLTPEELAAFRAGREAFDRFLTEGEGLGPAFNDFSCGLCHLEPTSGGASERFVTLFGHSGPPFDAMVDDGGPLLQSQATLPDFIEFIPSHSDVQAQRVTPHVFGAGLVERIPDAELLALEGRCGAVLRGRAHRVTPLEGGPVRVGRFGWKAQMATLLSFSADAARNELGLTSALLPDESCDVRDPTADPAPDPEDAPDAEGWTRIERMVAFQRLLAPPPQTPRTGMAGERVFARIGCADCHVPRFVTPAGEIAALSRVAFQPYSDFLLHDVGSLGDGMVQGEAGARQMRTAPLWGLSQRRFLGHDGLSIGATLAARVTGVVLRHDGEAAPARDAFTALDAADRGRLFAFLGSLGRAEFDADGDHYVDCTDWTALESWITGPGAVITPDDAAAVCDVDADGDVDLRDVGLFQRAFTGPRPAAPQVSRQPLPAPPPLPDRSRPGVRGALPRAPGALPVSTPTGG